MDDTDRQALMQALATRYPQRAATASEQQFFQRSPSVAGYAAPDQAVVLNPFLQRSPQEQEAVLMNERLRQAMLPMEMVPPFYPVDHQQRALQDTPYAGGGRPADETGWARLLSGDPSLAPYTMQQHTTAEQLGKRLK